jgi:hypothetical protein
MPFDGDSELMISQKPMNLYWKDNVYELLSSVFFSVERGIRIVTAPLELDVQRPPDLEDSYKIKRKAGGQAIDVMPLEIPIAMTGKLSVQWHFTPRTEPVYLDDESPLRCVRFAVVNFGRFYAQYPNQSGLVSNRLDLAGNGWVLKLEPMIAGAYGDVSAAETALFKFTHAGVLAREGDEAFSCDEAHAALDSVASFLSFCRGRWVAPALVKGFTVDGAVGMQEWGTRVVEPYTEGATWLDRMHAQEMAKAFAGYMRTAADPDWHDAVSAAIYWYTRTNGTPAGADGSVILLQAALERLAWQLLVRDKAVLSSDGFTRLPAADQLRLLLDRCSVPLRIPDTLKDLVSQAAAFNWADGPQAFVEIRNSVVHPPKRGNFPKPPIAIIDAWLLGQWYLELVLLKLFDFNGKYANRTRKPRWVGQVENVPWV